MSSRHNLGAYEDAGLPWHHVPVESAQRGAEALEELLPLLRRELRRRGAVAVHGDRHTDFVAAVCAAHLHEAREVEPAEALARAAAAGLMVNGYTCALLGVEPADVDALMRAGAPANGGIEGVVGGVPAEYQATHPARFLLSHPLWRVLAEDQVRRGFP